MSALLVSLHKLKQVELLARTRNLFSSWDMYSTEQRATFENNNFYFLKYFSNIILSNKIKSKRLVRMIPGIGNTLWIKTKLHIWR